MYNWVKSWLPLIRLEFQLFRHIISLFPTSFKSLHFSVFTWKPWSSIIIVLCIVSIYDVQNNYEDIVWQLFTDSPDNIQNFSFIKPWHFINWFFLLSQPQPSELLSTLHYPFIWRKEQSVSKCYSFKQHAGTIEMFKTSIKTSRIASCKTSPKQYQWCQHVVPVSWQKSLFRYLKNSSDFATRKEPFSTSCYNWKLYVANPIFNHKTQHWACSIHFLFP